MYRLVVLSAVLAAAFAAPSGLLYGGVAPLAYSPLVSAVPVAPALAVSKTVHYAPAPVVTGYTSTVVKPNLGHLATPLHTVTKTAVLAPARAVDTVVPQVTRVEPQVAVKQVLYDVPVHTPVLSHVELKANPAPVAVPVAVPAVKAVSPALIAPAHSLPLLSAPAHTLPLIAH